jgi:hypothetical protein
MKSQNKYNRKVSNSAPMTLSNYKKEKDQKKEKKMPRGKKGEEKTTHYN